MDPLTHSVFGVACAIAGTRQKVSRRAAALAGLAGGLLPDADVLLRSASDPLFTLEYHRHFTHSFAFAPVIALMGAIIASLILRAFRHTVPWQWLFFPALLGGLSHIFCDAWTSYGTRLWWPIAQTRVGLDWISIIDPVLTVPLVACIALAVRYASRKAASVGLAWVTLYLGFCLVQRHRAATALDQWLATSPMKPIDRRELKPSFGNVVVWRVLLQAGQECHVMAVRCPLFGETVVLPGTSQPMFATAEAAILALQVPAGSRQAKDIQRFHDFSAGWIGQLPSDAMILGDLRYSSLPTEIRPLWGIQVNPAEPESHVAMRHFRADRTPSLNRLMKMVQGTPAAPAALP
jgi:inner membrane protein